MAKTLSIAAGLQRHREITARPVKVSDLQRRFSTQAADVTEGPVHTNGSFRTPRETHFGSLTCSPSPMSRRHRFANAIGFLSMWPWEPVCRG